MSEWNKYFVTAQEFHDSIIKLANMIPKDKYKYIYAIPRGGLTVGVYLSHYLEYDNKELEILDKHEFALQYTSYLKKFITELPNVLIVDNLADTGKTLDPNMRAGFDTAVIHYKPRSIVKPTYYVEECPNDRWIVYPFEKPDEEPNREV